MAIKAEKNPTTAVTFEVFGPTVEFLTAPDDELSDFCVMKGIVPPGVFVPLHSHADTEDFIIISGTMQVLRQDDAGHEWLEGHIGDYFHVPANAPHAWRNVSNEPAVALITTTKKMGTFFQEAGRPATGGPQPVTPEELMKFFAVCAKYGYWNATPEENAAVGIQL